MRLTDQLLIVADAYGAASRLSRDRVSTLVLSGGKRLQRIAEGGDLNTATFEGAMQWFSDNWPDGACWPEGVPRPAPSVEGAAA